MRAEPRDSSTNESGPGCIINIRGSVVFLQGLFTGIIESDCLMPCIKTKPLIIEGTRIFMNQSESFVSLAFSKTVEVRKTTVDIFSIQESLNFLGSNLGLWPGLGLYQILELLIGMFFG